MAATLVVMWLLELPLGETVTVRTLTRQESMEGLVILAERSFVQIQLQHSIPSFSPVAIQNRGDLMLGEVVCSHRGDDSHTATIRVEHRVSAKRLRAATRWWNG